MNRVITLLATLVLTTASVKAISTDGEATIYLSGSYSGDFDVAYRARLGPSPHNTSWTTLGILLIGNQIPGPSGSVGLESDAQHPGTVLPYTALTRQNLRIEYKSYRIDCTGGCVIELRGDAKRISAYARGVRLASWPRSVLNPRQAYVQLNAEAHGDGDSLVASLSAVRTIAGGRRLPPPVCGFTTRGIKPAGRGILSFTGDTNNAGGAYVNLATGARVPNC